MSVGTDGKHSTPTGNDHPGDDHPCPFAGVALAAITGFAPDTVGPARIEPTSGATFSSAAIGRGLAAPPPPPTGPPLFV